MKFGPVPLGEAEGKILAHNIAGGNRRGAFRKGRHITAGDVSALLKAGCETIYVAELERGDIDENSAARRIANAAVARPGMLPGVQMKGSSQGRVSLVALSGGVLRVDTERLARVNECEGVTFATLRDLSIITAGQTVGTVKIIPYALPVEIVEQAERIASEGSSRLIAARAFVRRRVGVIYSGSEAARERVIKSFDPPLRKRMAAFEAQVAAADYVSLLGMKDEDTLAGILHHQTAQGAELIIMAGETSTMDRNDIIPRAVRCAGGQVACVGAPIEPGNLVMLAYLGDIPVLGVPGCIRSPKPTLVDQILAALLAGERLTRADITALGHGGLLEEKPHGI